MRGALFSDSLGLDLSLRGHFVSSVFCYHMHRSRAKGSSSPTGIRSRVERIMAPLPPATGDIMSFRYPDERFHRFYDSFPYGRTVRPFAAFVDLHGTILVQDVQTRTIDGIEWVAVQFTAVNGTILWTNFSKGEV